MWTFSTPNWPLIGKRLSKRSFVIYYCTNWSHCLNRFFIESHAAPPDNLCWYFILLPESTNGIIQSGPPFSNQFRLLLWVTLDLYSFSIQAIQAYNLLSWDHIFQSSPLGLASLLNNILPSSGNLRNSIYRYNLEYMRLSWFLCMLLSQCPIWVTFSWEVLTLRTIKCRKHCQGDMFGLVVHHHLDGCLFWSWVLDSLIQRPFCKTGITFVRCPTLQIYK